MSTHENTSPAQAWHERYSERLQAGARTRDLVGDEYAARDSRRRKLLAGYGAENDDMTGDGRPVEPDRYAVVCADGEHLDEDRALTTWQTFEDACAHVGDQILDGRTYLDGVYDLDTGELLGVHVAAPVVTRSEETGCNVLDEPDEPACDCDGDRVPGACWPMASGGDESRPWVERCDNCRRYPDDEAAAEAVAAAVGGTVEHARLAGCERPYVVEPEEAGR